MPRELWKGAILFGSQDDRLYCLEPDGHLFVGLSLSQELDDLALLG